MNTPPDTEKRAPVQGYPGGIPWAIHLEAYEVYCRRYGPQPALIDLEGRGCRGGFGTRELDDFIPGWRDRVSEFGKLKAEVQTLRAALAQHEARFRFLHSVNEDAEGYEWGVCRVKFVGGSPVAVLWGLSDHSDIDAAMQAAAKG